MHTDHLGRAGHFIILVLVAAAIVAGIIGEPSDAIAVIVLLNAMFGLVQEYRLDLLLIALALSLMSVSMPQATLSAIPPKRPCSTWPWRKAFFGMESTKSTLGRPKSSLTRAESS